MPDFRVHCRPTEAEPRSLVLDAAESHHLVRVNRARVGDVVIAFDGRGGEWRCELVADRKGGAELRVLGRQPVPVLPWHITLAQAIPKGKHLQDIIRATTEIGVSRIVPLLTERTIVQIGGDREETKHEKWTEAALEACKQCGNPYLPEIAPPTKLASLLAQPGDHDLKLIASLHPGARTLKEVFAAHAAAGKPPARSALWLVGPEGDFTPVEMAAALAAGFEPVTLGPLVLRCETAAVYAVSVLTHEIGGGGGIGVRG